jgi:putative CocE/NonD family hydrolase
MPAPLMLLAALGLAPVSPPYQYTSRYLTMRDGIRIAVDSYLPADLKPGVRLPTILLQTRYFRAHRVVWPATLFWGGILEPRIARYVAAGYAFVVVDARGSGASFGTRSQEWSPDEIRDGAEVVDWIITQPWSNRLVGATGISYEGTASEFLLANAHPAVVAVAPQSGHYDAYTDTAFPGGVKQEPFIAFWSRMTAAQDANRMNSMLTGIGKIAYRGVKPVQGDSGEALLAAASRGHATNYNVAAAIARLEFRDQTGQVAAMSPYARRDDIERSGAAIYSRSGWYDAALVNGAIKRFLNVRTPGSRLILGPWSHAAENLSPFAAALKDFDHTADIIAFFDRHLKVPRRAESEEAPVRYYTVGEERWKTASTWPPPGTAAHQLFLSAGGTLASGPASDSGADRYTVDFTTGTGQTTRWNNQTKLDAAHSLPRDRAERDRKLLVYTGAPLDADLEVTGHPRLTLHLESTARDGAVFVYLEDVDPRGRVRYVTEGMLRLISRAVSTGPAPYVFPGILRTFSSRDTLPMLPGRVAEVDIDLFPISYLFRRGHSVRVALAGADADHFARYPAAPAEPPTWTIHRDPKRRSAIMLPVGERPIGG